VETARLELPGTPAAPSVARLFVRNLCQEWGAGSVCDIAELLSSELVTNAVVHARSSVELEAAYDDCSVLRIEWAGHRGFAGMAVGGRPVRAGQAGLVLPRQSDGQPDSGLTRLPPRSAISVSPRA